MCNEVNLSSVDCDAYDKYYGSSFSQPTSSTPNLAEAIFSQPVCSHSFTKYATFHRNLVESELRTGKVAQDNRIASMDAGGSVTVGGTISWGGSGGTTGSIGVSAEGHDDNGNSVEVEINQDSSGEGSISISASHDEE